MKQFDEKILIASIREYNYLIEHLPKHAPNREAELRRLKRGRRQAYEMLKELREETDGNDTDRKQRTADDAD